MVNTLAYCEHIPRAEPLRSIACKAGARNVRNLRRKSEAEAKIPMQQVRCNISPDPRQGATLSSCCPGARQAADAFAVHEDSTGLIDAGLSERRQCHCLGGKREIMQYGRRGTFRLRAQKFPEILARSDTCRLEAHALQSIAGGASIVCVGHPPLCCVLSGQQEHRAGCTCQGAACAGASGVGGGVTAAAAVAAARRRLRFCSRPRPAARSHVHSQHPRGQCEDCTAGERRQTCAHPHAAKAQVPMKPKAAHFCNQAQDLGKPPAVAITTALEKSFLDKAVAGLGLVVTLYDILSIGDGYVYPSDGGAHYKCAAGSACRAGRAGRPACKQAAARAPANRVPCCSPMPCLQGVLPCGGLPSFP